MNRKDINGIILAGGRSSRMGTDKALLELDGKKIIEHIIDVLRPNVNRIMIIASDPCYNRFNYPVYKDIEESMGPAGGIHTGLVYSTTELNFVVSCDLPFLTSEMIAYIIKNINASTATVPVHKSNPEPLCAVYLKSQTRTFFRAIAAQRLKMKDLLAEIRPHYISVDKEINFGAMDFTNVNTPEEFSRIKNKQHDYSR